ncbi:NADPH:quinone reductase-like Zn-dependent oxidoreductase [Cereibacter ovatus]|uniref:NADPH:quinone reductase-like Zn-dependent oxidoreductase n=1 Tax=Cereibacter ovatus TaxID=439529 RepID=A0A285CSZ2_9RHOB|nr:quinone oxidoreductase [Cereibacter ovatus]SNX70176.1 NADPH:quinone reductase-like Zn-dependent oxidoreductase [Cereibacter ovatus]
MTDFAIVARRTGGPEVLEWAERPAGRPGPGEVLIRQTAVGLNFIDCYFRSGLYPWPGEELIPGGEAAGVVEAMGEGVVGFAVGDRVAYTMPNGAYRTHRVVPAAWLVKLSAGVSDEIAASIMLKGLTAHYLIHSSFRVEPGHVVLVHAAAGGVGQLLGQWLKAKGATAIGTVGGAAKVAAARAAGYDHVIDYDSADFPDAVREITAGRGCDVVYDSVGRTTWRGSLKSLRTRGSFICFGQSSGPLDEFRFSDLAVGSFTANRPSLFHYVTTRDELEARAADLFAMIGSGQLRSQIGQRFALKDAASAHHALEQRQTTGATVLLP